MLFVSISFAFVLRKKWGKGDENNMKVTRPMQIPIGGYLTRQYLSWASSWVVLHYFAPTHGRSTVFLEMVGSMRIFEYQLVVIGNTRHQHDSVRVLVEYKLIGVLHVHQIL